MSLAGVEKLGEKFFILHLHLSLSDRTLLNKNSIEFCTSLDFVVVPLEEEMLCMLWKAHIGMCKIQKEQMFRLENI